MIIRFGWRNVGQERHSKVEKIGVDSQQSKTELIRLLIFCLFRNWSYNMDMILSWWLCFWVVWHNVLQKRCPNVRGSILYTWFWRHAPPPSLLVLPLPVSDVEIATTFHTTDRWSVWSVWSVPTTVSADSALHYLDLPGRADRSSFWSVWSVWSTVAHVAGREP